MRIKRDTEGIQEGDLTPMIDMTFQLIAFFMVLINFSQAESDDRIKLPKSTLAKPPEAPLQDPITLHLTKDGDIVVGGQKISMSGLVPFLRKEVQVLSFDNKTPADATVIIRADAVAKVYDVQHVIKLCQDNKFEKFALRAEEKVD